MLHIIVNPTAGNGRAERVGRQVIETLTERNIAFQVRYTEHVGHATELAAEAAKEGSASVVAVGGDGTVLETMRGIFGTDAALGIIPSGTGNDVVKMLGTPRQPLQALDFILQHPARRLDAGRINDTLFLNVCGTGFDVVVLDYAKPAKRYVSGMLPYLWGVIRTIFAYKPVHLTVEIDGEAPFTRDILIVAVANGQYIGGGINVAPEARPDDGLFDMLVIDNLPRWKMPFQLPKLLTGKIRSIPGTLYRNCRHAVLSAEGMRMNIDGEIVQMDRAELEMLPASLMAHW